MIVKRLERKVVDAVSHEQATSTLARMVRGVMIEFHGMSIKSMELIETRAEVAMRFITAYVQSTPAVVSAVVEAGDTAGVLSDLQPVLDEVDDYFTQAMDLIPDHLGLAGVTDDAYVTHSILQRMGDEHQDRTGVPLFSIDVRDANHLMRRMIGEPVATGLDATADAVLGRRAVQLGCERLAKARVALKLRMPHPYENFMVSGDDLDLRIGTLSAGMM